MSRYALPALLAASVVWQACSPPPTSEASPPTITVQEPQEGSVLTQETLVLSGKITTEGTPLSSAEYQVQDGDWAPLAVDDSGSFSATVTAPRAAGMTLALKVRATNAADKQSEESVEVVLQNAGPTLAITSPVQDAVLGPAAVDTVTFTGTALDRMTQAPATVTLDFQDGQGPRAVSNDASGFSLTVPLPLEDHQAHEVTVVATDARGNSTSETLRVYVDRVAPSLTITSPTEGQPFARAAFASGDEVAGTFTRTDGDPALTLEMDLGAGWTPVQGTGFVVVTSPTDDGVSYTLRLRATDTAGNATVVSRSFGVDRVAPTATFDRADGSRLNPPSIALSFSEPVTAAAAPFALVPAAGTPSSSAPFAGQSFGFTALPGDSVFTATLAAGAVADAFGNTNDVAATVKFHTRPAQPASGVVQTLRSDVVAFDVASDPDGVVSLVMETTGTGKPMALTWFDGATGAPVSGVIGSRPQGTLVQLAATTWSQVHADLSTHRSRGFREAYSTEAFAGGVSDGTVIPGTSGDAFFVPIGPGCADDPAAPAYGRITTGGQFLRGGVAEAVTVVPWRLLLRSPEDWELVGVSSGALVAQARTCTCGAQSACAWQSARTLTLPGGATLAANPHLSVTGTAAGERSLYVVDTTSGLRAEVCETRCAAGTSCPPGGSQSTPLAEQLFVASAGNGNQVIGARRSSSGVQLLRRDLQNGCGGAWTVVATAPGSTGSSVTAWRPVMFGASPGLVWLDGNDLRLYIP